ncbi:MAG: aspartate kinase [Bacteroidota bacterium]|nr:aspartate kinase [Bacteroidota bacterium]
MQIRVFKFGGASVNSAKGVQNVATILKHSRGNDLILVVSAMGKTTNALEGLLSHFLNNDYVATVDTFQKIYDFHFSILNELFPAKENPVYKEVETLFDHLRGHIRKGHLDAEQKRDYNFEYDQLISYGEMISTTILHHYLESAGVKNQWFDVRNLIRTDSTYRDAKIDWGQTRRCIKDTMETFFCEENKKGKIALTQGFIGRDPEGNTTTLGREGSDFTAAIFAFSLGIDEVTIWKDVPGVMNADPKWFHNPKKLDTLSYLEAIELAYYGASIIHPKTIKPLENANITLKVKSFLKPSKEGTIIKNLKEWSVPFPIYIRKTNQVLISLSPKDFSFILEENLGQIFTLFAKRGVKVNVMQNSAVSFSVCVDDNDHILPLLLSDLQLNYNVRYNAGLELYTIRHYTPMAIRKVVKEREVLLEQRTRNTIHLLIIPGLQPGSHI